MLSWLDRALEENGFAPANDDMFGGWRVRLKLDSGVPQRMASFDTAFLEDHVIEGHVPATGFRRLLEERPDTVGLAVPGLACGSPGMGSKDDREACDVFLTSQDGSTEISMFYAEN
ncbi:DUF411 domain-containing protein [Aliiroseovarius sediminilitoris]|uniref:DUF411 domain-containing protein n=1 Tax=Aliiroseovarius sediminilitoris TaxID=1173584 RepID=UPI001FE057EE